MDSKPELQREYHEGPRAAKRFEQFVGKVIAVPHEEIKRRDEEWKQQRKQKDKSR